MLRRKSSKDKKAKKPKKEKKAKAKKPKKAKAKKREGVVVKKTETDIYTVMLCIALAAVLLACLLMWFELKNYGEFPQWRV